MLQNKLLKLRDFHNLKQKDISAMLGVSREAYSLYESGKVQMSYESLNILADFYHVTIDYILGRCNKDEFLCTKEEREHLEKFRKLDEHGKQVVATLLEMEYKRTK